MIIQETVGNLIRTYSDQNKYIRQNETGYTYSEAYDLIPCAFTYSETEEDIEP